MSWAILTCVLLGVAPASGGNDSAEILVSPDALAFSAPAARSGAELGKAAHETLGRWARTADKQPAAAAREYLAVYGELARDTRLPRGERNELMQKLRGRLAKLLPEVNKRLGADQRLATSITPASVSAGLVADPVLGQLGGGFGGVGNGRFGGMQGGAGFGGVGMGMGGPGGYANRFGPEDAGQDLVDLIQKTIAPASWSANGGMGAIYYWQPGRALVISASDGVQERANDLLEQLRRAGN